MRLRIYVVLAAIAAVAAIVAGPAGAATSAGVTFTSTPPLSSRQGPQAFTWSATGKTSCSLDGAAFAPCSSPRTYSSLALGDHSLTVALQSDLRGTAIQYIWTVTPVGVLDVLFTAYGGPVFQTMSHDMTFAWLSHQVGARFVCSLDGAAFAACSAPRAYHGLATGDHSFAVRATNTLGEVSVPATYGWTIEPAGSVPSMTCAAAIDMSLLADPYWGGNIVVPPGASCELYGANIGGSVFVGAGARFTMNSSVVQLDVISVGSAAVTMGIGGGVFPPGHNTILGSVRISGLSNGGEFAPLFIAGNTVDGNIEVDSSSIGSGIAFIGEVAPNIVGGNIRVDGNLMGLRVTSNVVSGHLRATGNTATVGALSVSFNTVGGNLEYSRNVNTPYFLGNGVTGALSCVGNTALGDTSGTVAGSYLPGQCVGP